MNVATNSDYWGTQATDAEAMRAAEALASVLRYAAEKLGFDVEIGTSPDGDGANEDDSDEQIIAAISESVWQYDAIQAAAFDESPVDAVAMLRQYNEELRRNGGTGYFEFD